MQELLLIGSEKHVASGPFLMEEATATEKSKTDEGSYLVVLNLGSWSQTE